jgi:amino acid transporter
VLGYLLPVGAALAAGVDPAAWKNRRLKVIGTGLGGPWLGIAMALGGMASMAGLFGALLLSYSRIPFVLAQDGYLPAALARVHRTRGTPWVAIAVSATACTALVPFPFQKLVVFDVLLYFLALALQCATLVRRRLAGAPAGSFQIPGRGIGVTLVVGSLAAVALVAIIGTDRFALLFSAAAAVTGPLVYAVVRVLRRRSQAKTA